MGSVDYFLKVEGIPGEATSKGHENEIEVESWSFGSEQAGTMAFGGGGGAGKVQVEDFQFLMKINKASPKLFLACCTGEHFRTATLVARKAGKDQQEFLRVTFTDLLVSKYQTTGSGSSGIVPSDKIALNFAVIEVEYRPQKADGTLGAGVKVKYDLKQMKAG